MTRRDQILALPVPTVEERIRQIESEPLPANIGALLDAAAIEHPQRLAWNFFEAGDTITYGDLRKRVDRLAHGLHRAGVTPGMHVGVMLPNVPAFPVTWLALARMGAVMVPLNIAYTAREITFVVENGDVQFLIVDATCLPAVEELSPLPGMLAAERVIVAGDCDGRYRDWETLLDADDSPWVASPPVALDDVANIQYTSGTTGFPKGCILSHRYWLTISKVNARRDGMAYRNILCATPFFYMDPQWLLLMTFHQRGTLFVARRQSPSRFMGWVREHRVHFCLLPYLVIKQPEVADEKRHELIRCNIYGIPKDVHRAIEERFDLIAREAFGMTEAGTCLFMPIAAADMVGSGSCGKPGPFREARIVDEDGRIVAQGEIGELQLRGPGDAAGLLQESEGHRRGVRRRLVPHRRPFPPGRARLLLHRRPAEGHDPPRRREHRGARSRDGGDGAARGHGSRVCTSQGRHSRRRGQGLRRPAAGVHARKRAAAAHHRALHRTPGALQGAALHRVQHRAAENALGQDRQEGADPGDGRSAGRQL